TLIIFFVYDQFLGLSSLSGASSTGPRTWLSRAGAWAGNCVLAALATLSSLLGAAYGRIVPPRGAAPRREMSRVTLGITCLLVLVLLCLPALFLIPVSFTEDGFMAWPPKGFSWQWYESVVTSELWIAAAARSLVIA